MQKSKSRQQNKSTRRNYHNKRKTTTQTSKSQPLSTSPRLRCPQKHEINPRLGVIKMTRHSMTTTTTKATKSNPKFPIAKLAQIDLRSFFDETGTNPIPPSQLVTLSPVQQHTVDKLTMALTQQGFFFVTNVPIQPLIHRIHQTSNTFFKLPADIKAKSAAQHTRRGWHRFQAAPDTISEHNDSIEAFTMQTPYHTDQELVEKYFNGDDNGGDDHVNNNIVNNYGIANFSLPIGVNIDDIKSSSNVTSTSTTITPQTTPKHIDTNNWPTSSSTQHHPHFNPTEFKSIHQQYWDMSVNTSQVIITVLALSLKIDPQELLDWHTTTQNHTLETKIYPHPNDKIAIPRGANLADELNSRGGDDNNDGSNNNNNASLDDVRIRFPIHSDLTSITLLTQTHYNGGLMIKTRSRGWERVGGPKLNQQEESLKGNIPSQPPVLVNIGQFLADFSAGGLHASLHCVVNVNDIEVDDQTNQQSLQDEIKVDTKVLKPPGNLQDLTNPTNPTNLTNQSMERISTVFFVIPKHDAIIRDIRDPSRPQSSHHWNANSTAPALPIGTSYPFHAYEAGDRLPAIAMM